MKDITVTAPDGKQSHLENVYIRGNMLRFIIVPDMLQQAPMFKRIGPNAMKGRGIGSARGRATVLRGEFCVHLGFPCLCKPTDVLTVPAFSFSQLQHKHDADEADHRIQAAVALLALDHPFADKRSLGSSTITDNLASLFRQTHCRVLLATTKYLCTCRFHDTADLEPDRVP